ncbi:hypothetical protein AVEN_4009-1 [Araneus ventricosus]|uniref:Uncharacterized protein n=1 Tax=Araneus ventricosus TaxID=182803 RepID=A0A4Y2H113_ARAVE|nr:hypothetical protein AVEN_4009-1 [Araneus ventricosus]
MPLAMCTSFHGGQGHRLPLAKDKTSSSLYTSSFYLVNWTRPSHFTAKSPLLATPRTPSHRSPAHAISQKNSRDLSLRESSRSFKNGQGQKGQSLPRRKTQRGKGSTLSVPFLRSKTRG